MGQDDVGARGGPAAEHFPDEKYITMETFRRKGTPVATPVWFFEENGFVYVGTFTRTGKVKRLRHTTRVRVAVCDRGGTVTGQWRAGEARLIAAGAEAEQAEQRLKAKYGLIKRASDWWYGRKWGPAIVVAIDLKPATP